MGHGVIDLISHVLAILFLVYRIAITSFVPITEAITQSIKREHDLRVCGSLIAATLNLQDTWQESAGRRRATLKAGYDDVIETLDAWSDEGPLPSRNSCERSSDQDRFRVDVYRLDGVDAPKRRVNWSYRISRGKES